MVGIPVILYNGHGGNNILWEIQIIDKASNSAALIKHII